MRGTSIGTCWARIWLACATLATVAGCGTYVPSHQEGGDELRGVILVTAIVESIHCELRNAVIKVVATDRSNPPSEQASDFFLDWAMQVALTLTIEEKGGFGPSIFMTFPPGLFTLGVGANVSSDAKRIDKFGYYYTVQDLLKAGPCGDGFSDTISAHAGSGSLLIRSDLKTREWLSTVLYSKLQGQGSEKSFTLQKNGFSHEVQFVVDTSASVTPGAKLATVTLMPGGSLLTAQRTRTHDLILTFGPASADDKKNRILAPAAQALFLANQISSALQSGLQRVRIVP